MTAVLYTAHWELLPSVITGWNYIWLMIWNNIVAYLHHVRIVTSKHAPAIMQ
jgi:hypothetical protein